MHLLLRVVMGDGGLLPPPATPLSCPCVVRSSPSQSTVLEAGERLMMDARLWQLAGTATASATLLLSGGHTAPGNSGALHTASSAIHPGEQVDTIMLGRWALRRRGVGEVGAGGGTQGSKSAVQLLYATAGRPTASMCPSTDGDTAQQQQGTPLRVG